MSEPLYSCGTWDADPDVQAFTPQIGTEPCINVPWRRLLQVLRLLRQLGYTAHYLRDPGGSHENNDPMVLVERTDGLTEPEILKSWRRPA